MQQALFETQKDQKPQPQAVNVQRLVSKPLLLHGDCIQLMASIAPASVDMVCCDPPYGTTACKNLGRNFIGIELDETYYQIATKRIEAC